MHISKGFPVFLIFTIHLVVACTKPDTLLLDSSEVKHLQQYYCESQFVFKIEVQSLNKSGKIKFYNIKVLQDYKNFLYKKNKADYSRLYIDSEQDFSNANIEIDKTYVVGGKMKNLGDSYKLFISKSDLVKDVSELTEIQEEGLNELYIRGCRCLEKENFCPLSEDSKIKDCQIKHGFCTSRRDECNWDVILASSNTYKECINCKS